MIETRTYKLSECEHFRFTKDRNGCLSNFPPIGVTVPTEAGDVFFRDTETLYNLLKFDNPESQRKVYQTSSPKEAKAVGGDKSLPGFRTDWDWPGRVRAMRYTCALKTAQNPEEMLPVLTRGEGKPIVEFSTKDPFWGAQPRGDTLVGKNVLGRIYMEIEAKLLEHPWSRFTALRSVAPPQDFRIFGAKILEWKRPAITLNAKIVGKDVPGAVYVGRPSPYGNPVPVSEDAPRGVAIMGFLEHLKESPALVEKIRADIGDKDVICWCAPRDCHADIIRYVAAGNPVPETWELRAPPPTERDQTSFDF